MNLPNDVYIYVIVVLLPLVAGMVVFQTNPYHALVIRGILGAIAAMVYSVLGAADVALTEALVGTMLAITLYAIAVRSSMVMRLGMLQLQAKDGAEPPENGDLDFISLMKELRTIFNKRHMQLELVIYTNPQALHRALMEKEVHTTCTRLETPNHLNSTPDSEASFPVYQLLTRIQRLYEILQTELSASGATLAYVKAPDIDPVDLPLANLEEEL
ncbi:MAG: DUF4040 domain-containing protein [Oscillatoriales cyanobacterium RM2_1_1]|nr:DUF4040 domain-containing protein [Oscillatoriales cyanobacterium SM2_3_0]NJO44303.1 DUF4040 domain-containing protein [Oscillatoriales cyanobacterium RM2_1_1]